VLDRTSVSTMTDRDGTFDTVIVTGPPVTASRELAKAEASLAFVERVLVAPMSSVEISTSAITF